eukprot:3416581-Amphidinium_carterae.1
MDLGCVLGRKCSRQCRTTGVSVELGHAATSMQMFEIHITSQPFRHAHVQGWTKITCVPHNQCFRARRSVDSCTLIACKDFETHQRLRFDRLESSIAIGRL